MDRWQDGVVHRMDVDALRSLVTVASFAGVGRAAAALHLSQPTVTGHLRRLERDLGVRLVEKVGRSIAFTPAGDELARRAHRIVALHDEEVLAQTVSTAAAQIASLDGELARRLGDAKPGPAELDSTEARFRLFDALAG